MINDVISECSSYETCRELWDRQVNDGRALCPFTCKDCIGYECYWRGYNDGIRNPITKEADNETD